ncbi:MAG TPA: methyltransferase domain-containing protein [Gemmatimonadaceae bacterium]|nr:methyltransferase domain-containing protein [Gemmatimonadaceae bacterium]
MARLTQDIGADTGVARRLTAGIEPPRHREILMQCLTGSLSPAVALMQLLIETEDVARVRATVDEVTRRAALVSRATDSLVRDRVDELTQLIVENEPGCERIAEMLRSNMDTSEMAPSVEEGIAFCERLFDWSVQQCEEASVALYSLGNPQLLERASREIIALLEQWSVLSQDRVVLDIGSGIGRIAAELAPRVKAVEGIDVSERMVDAAIRRYGFLSNVHFRKGSGRDLADFANACFDAAIAVDTFPYIYQSGPELVATYFAEARRVLRPGGDLVILNYSYRGDHAADAADVGRFADNSGFDVIVGGVQPFTMWDGLAFHLRKGL